MWKDFGLNKLKKGDCIRYLTILILVLHFIQVELKYFLICILKRTHLYIKSLSLFCRLFAVQNQKLCLKSILSLTQISFLF